MRKHVLYALMLATAISVTACGKNHSNQTESSQQTEQSDSAEKQTETAETIESESENTDAEHETGNANTDNDSQSEFFGVPVKPLNIELSAMYEGEWDNKGPIITADSATIHIFDDGCDELKHILDQYNEEKWQAVYAEYLELREYLKDDSFTPGAELFISRDIELTRADSRVLSFVNVLSSYTGGAHGSYGTTGENFDTQTGERLELTDVVTEYDQMYELIVKALRDNYEADDFFAEYENDLHDMFYKEESPYYGLQTWNLGMDGIHFTFDPYFLGPWASGSFEVEIPYEGNETIFAEEYVPVLCGGRFTKVENGDRLILDTNRNGIDELIRFDVSQMHEDYTMTLELAIVEDEGKTGYTHTLRDDYYGTFTDAYLVEIPDEEEEGESFYYLYVEFLKDNDFRVLYVIDLNGSEPIEMFRLNGESYASIYGHLIADPAEFSLFSRIYTLGTYTGYRTYHVGKNGMPEPDDSMYNLVSSGADWEILLTSKRELTVLMHGADGGEKTETKLPKGTTFRPRKTDGETVMEMELEDGRRCDIPLEKPEGDYQYYINGVVEDDCFEFLPYAG